MLIKLENITKTYNQGKDNAFRALKGVDLEIEAGDFIAIMGPSGSGKTTLMNILGALDTPTSGSYYLKETDISKFNDSQLADFRNQQVGFVFQQFNLLPRMSVLDNVLLPTVYGHLPDRNAKAIEVLKRVGLGEKIHSRPNELSGGQIQRVAVARALIMNPAIIMADEPTGNLDSKTSHEIMELLANLNADGNTIILVTHEEDIAAFAKETIRMKDGIIV